MILINDCSDSGLSYKRVTESTKASGREPKSCLGKVFNFKLGYFASQQNKGFAHMQPLLELKTRPKFYPANCSLSMRGIK